MQGFIIYRLLFGDDLSQARARFGGVGAPPPGPLDADARLSPSDEQQATALAHALAWVIWQAMTTADGAPLPGCSPTVVVAADEAALPLRPDAIAPGALVAHTLPPSLAAIEIFVRAHLPQFGSSSGVLLLLWSVLLSRGLARAAADMDEAAPLVARFGHCTQELLNLMLTGVASSNVFDGIQVCVGGQAGSMGAEVAREGRHATPPPRRPAPHHQRLDGEGAFDAAGAPPSEATSVNSIRGIAGRPIVGYLSHVEAMRYSRVGDFLKTPLVPVWLVRRRGCGGRGVMMRRLALHVCSHSPAFAHSILLRSRASRTSRSSGARTRA